MRGCFYVDRQQEMHRLARLLLCAAATASTAATATSVVYVVDVTAVLGGGSSSSVAAYEALQFVAVSGGLLNRDGPVLYARSTPTDDMWLQVCAHRAALSVSSRIDVSSRIRC
jgi:hypothetical protein